MSVRPIGATRRAIALFAAKSRRPEREFTAIGRVLAANGYRPSAALVNHVGIWLDFADPETGCFGQCCLRRDGSWSQPPRGTAPVLLEWTPDRDVARRRR